ncbi:hypothetical protein ACI65C_003033 [Semiaphis heraclei]
MLSGYNSINGFVLPNEKYVGKAIFQKLISIDAGRSDYKLAPKLTERHIEVQGTGRMNVKLAANVFSNTVSKALAYLGTNNYIETLNWKDASILVCNISLKNLLDDLKSKYSLKYIITKRLNQDTIENLFSYLKGMAGSASNNITALDFKYSLRWFILGKHSDFVFTENTNSEVDMEKSLLNESDCLTSLMLNSDAFNETDDPSEHNNETANIESSSGSVSKSSVPKECFDLLTEFEMENSEPFNEIELDCAQYVAGYVANRFSNKYPELIKQIDDKTVSCWTSCKSRGGLKLPSDNMMVAVKKLEVEFQKLHQDRINKNKNIMKTMTNLLMPHIENLSIPKEAIECLVRTRTFIRLNDLNNRTTEKNYIKRQEKRKKQKFIN